MVQCQMVSSFLISTVKDGIECLTVAGDRSAVLAPTRPPLVTQRRRPASVTVTVMVVVTQLVRENNF